MKLTYNSPVILSFTLISALVLAIDTFAIPNFTETFFITSPHVSFLNPLYYFRLFSHVIGHANFNHFIGNFTLILLIGPLLEEKFGSLNLLIMILITALTTALLNNTFLDTGLAGASGIVFMLIMLGSLTNFKAGYIPLTFVLIFLLFMGREVVEMLSRDNISQFAHIIGGICGALIGFSFAKPQQATPIASYPKTGIKPNHADGRNIFVEDITTRHLRKKESLRQSDSTSENESNQIKIW